MLFGKNSDRQRNEAQTVEYFPACEHPPGTSVRCTYIDIPQAARTNAVLLCRPFWTWGAEMGANEHGVAIGNEAVRAKLSAPEAEALIGMDLLRLALERARSAAQAVAVITALLERHGQGGNCGHLTPSYYNNAFMIADAKEAFILETVGREWLVEAVHGVRAISNRYSIGRGAQLISAGLAALVRDNGWSTEADPSYAEAIASTEREHIVNAAERSARAASLLRSRAPAIATEDMMAIQRDHCVGETADARWTAECTVKRSLCMHAGAEESPGQTVGALVSELRDSAAVHWVTGTAAPCLSIFRPFVFGVPLPAHGPRPTERFDGRALWWRHEQLHRAAIAGDFARFLSEIEPERNALEARFRARVDAVLDGSESDKSCAIATCWREASEMEDRWLARATTLPPFPDRAGTAAWMRLSRLAGLHVESTTPPEQSDAN